MFDAYLKLEDVEGGSTSMGYEGQIEVLKFEHEIRQPVTESHSMAAHGSVGRSQHGELLIHKVLDRSTPWLAQVCSAGDALKEGKMTIVQAEGTGDKAIKTELMTVYMTGVRVSSIALEGGRDNEPAEVIGLSYDTIYWTYKTQEGAHVGSWNLATNAIEAPAPE